MTIKSFLLHFIAILALNYFAQQYQVSCSLPTELVNEFSFLSHLIEATFNGYECLNILYIRDDSSELQASIIRAAHGIENPLSIQLIESLENATYYCGFLVVSTDLKGLEDFAYVRYEDVIRVLYIDFSFADNENLLLLDSDEMRLHDMDLAIVKMNKSEEAIRIFIKSRYENKTHVVVEDYTKEFFHHKNYIPTSVNYNKKIVRAMTFDFSIFNIIIDNELVDGVEARIYRELERKLNFTAVTMLPQDGVRWGLAFPNGTITGGILKALYRREVDIGLGAFWVDFSKLWVSAFSNYYAFECLQFLIPKPKLKPPRWDNMLKPLPRLLWILIFFGLVLVSSACYVLRYLEEKKLKTIFGGTDISIVYEFITVFGIFLLAKNPEKNHGQSANRHIFMWWSLFALLITTLYSSSLVSHLTYPQFEPMIETVEGLVKAGYYWGTDYPIMSDRFMDVENPWHAAFMKSHRMEADTNERVRRLKQGNYSILAKIVGDHAFIEVDGVPIDMLHDLRTTRDCHFYFYVAYVVRKAFPLTLVADQVTQQLIESGIIQYWLDRLFEQKYPLITFSRVYEYKMPPEEIELKPLNVKNLQGAFLILIIGLQIASITLICEILKKCKLNKCKHL